MKDAQAMVVRGEENNFDMAIKVGRPVARALQATQPCSVGMPASRFAYQTGYGQN